MNRFARIINGTRTQTSSILDRVTGKVVEQALTPLQIAQWLPGANADAKAGKATTNFPNVYDYPLN